MLHCGIVGLPLCGKTTIFNVITRSGAEVKSYAGGKTDPNRAVVSVPDARVDRLSEVHQPKKTTPAQVEFVDLAGISKGASKGSGLGNAFLSFVADADALLHVIRCFANKQVEHPEGNVDPVRDWDIMDTELILRDLGVVDGRLSRLRAKKKLTPEETMELDLLQRCEAHLSEERPLSSLGLSDEEERFLRGFTFLSSKPQIIVLNVDETQGGPDFSKIPNGAALEAKIKSSGASVITVYGQLEMDLLDLSDEEAAEFTAGLSIEEPGRERLISEAYKTLGLISFFTCGPDEVRAWTIRDGQNAVDAAGAIHSDLARGFIRAQVVSYDDYTANGDSLAKCRDTGVLRLEGKDYKVRDGDIIEIRFNV